ncbi:MAG: putative sulfate exporter family transporter [Phycisphaeraceae bacterium]|nr:putative sulfate exporter family transporter [Phycisphaeraceae bacterium]
MTPICQAGISLSDHRANNPYLNPDIATWMGGLEGVPDPISPVETPAEQAARAGWQNKLNDQFALIGVVLPGLGLALILALLGKVLAQFVGVNLLGFDRSPVSAIFIAIIAGLLIRNVIGLPSVYSEGLDLCLKKILRLGIVLLGIRLSLAQVGEIGAMAMIVIAGCIIAALVLVTLIGKALKLPKRLATLIAVGTSICGVSAVAATGPVIHAEEDEMSYAVATIALFGMLALVLHPFIAHGIFPDDPKLAGVFLGTAVHDTAQVAGSALIYEQQYDAPEAIDYAVVTKLLRNLCMVIVIPLMAVLYHRGNTGDGRSPKVSKLIPLFVFGFLGMTIFRSVGDLGLGGKVFGVLSPEAWRSLITMFKSAAEWCLVLAMAAVGLGTSVAKLRTLGLRPFLVGFAAASLVGLTSVLLIRTVVVAWGFGS